MFIYYLRLAWLSIRRNPILSSLMMAAIALGIGAAMTTLTVNYLMSSNPIPSKSEQLFYVQLDSWSPDQPYEEPNEPPDQLTFRDATNLKALEKARYQAAMTQSAAVIEPSGLGQKPFMAHLRLTHNDFFNLFEPPFLYGQPWSDDADKSGELTIVLNKETNDKLFDGANSVGQTITMMDRQFTVVGVLDEWELKPRFYDVTTGAFNNMEHGYVPFILRQTLEMPNSGNTNCWKSPEGEGFEAFLQSECINYQFWVQLDSSGEEQDYLTFLNAYVEEQKQLGRFPRPLNNRLSDVMEWMENQQVVDDDAQVMMYLAFMFLVVCLLNTVGLLLTKFVSKSGEIALRRAVGASRSQLYLQHLVETALIGLGGGIGGLFLAWLGLQGIKALYGTSLAGLAYLDLNLIAMGIALAIVSSMLAGAYPTWRACRIPPASQLKTQ